MNNVKSYSHTVSVIMPAHNARETIGASIDSVQQQTYTDWELIIVNDASTDDTTSVVMRYVADSRISLISSENNVGMSAARNLAVKSARGRYIAFLDADDLWTENKLECQIRYHTEHPECSVSHTSFTEFSDATRERRPWRQLVVPARRKRGNLLPLLYTNNVVATLTVVMLRNLFIEMNGFDASLFAVEDLDLWIRLSKRGYGFGYIDEVLAKYRVVKSGASKNTSKYRRSFRDFIKRRIIDDPEIDEEVKGKSLANYFLVFGRLYHKRGEYRLANKYYAASLCHHYISITDLVVTIIFLVQSELRLFLYRFPNALGRGR